MYRIKAVQTIGIALPSSSGRTSTIIACTVSSDGNVNLYDIAAIPEQPSTDTPQTTRQIEPLTTYDSKGTRLTCVTLADGDVDIDATVNGKRKREDDEDGNGNGDEDEHEHRHESDQEELDGGSDEEELEDEAENAEEDEAENVEEDHSDSD
jgi:protein MAK11